MSKSLVLEDFSKPTDPALAQPSQEAPLAATDDASSLDAYESGYKNGWADCAVAEAEERKSVGAQLAERVREAELTYDTARRDLFDALEPFFEDLIATLLPRIAAAAIAPNVSHELRSLLEQHVEGSAEILAAPSSCESLQRLADAQGLDAVTVRAEPAFADTQVSIRVGCERRDIDLSEVAEKISAAIHDFQSQTEKNAPTQGAT